MKSKTKYFVPDLVPSHFFEHGNFEVWSPMYEWKGGKQAGKRTMQKIAGELSEETAKAFDWPGKEIRQNKNNL